MSRWIPYEERSIEEIQAMIDREFEHWNDMCANGCNDPNWHDGVNMNLTRNHILYYYRILDGKTEQGEQLTLFSAITTDRRPVPPEVPQDYMAKPDELVEGAKRTLAAILQDENYKYLASLDKHISTLARKNSSYDNIIKYPVSLKHALETLDYPRMRSYQNTEYWINGYVGMRKRIDEEIQRVKSQPQKKRSAHMR